MKKLLIRFLTIIIYLVALLWLTEFKLWVLLDIKTILMSIFGTVLLTLSGYKKGMPMEDLKASAGWNAMLTAYLTTFILLFSRLSGSQNTDRLLYDVAMNCRPLLYGLIINILLRGDERKSNINASDQQEFVNEDSEKKPYHEDSYKIMLQKEGLTERETEIACDIIQGLSNREIGEKLFISESTVKKHTSNLYKKLGINNREQLKQYIKDN
jgi:DNA-binding CsgD family transcriptional regulator